jgi:hypothetical protein
LRTDTVPCLTIFPKRNDVRRFVPADHGLIVSVNDCLSSLDEIGVKLLPALGLPDHEPKHF